MAPSVFAAFTFCLWLITSGGPLAAQIGPGVAGNTIRLSLAEARTRALGENPDLRAERLDTAVARGQLRQAGVIRFNPSADVVARPNGDDLEAGISQEIEIFGQRGTRVAAGRAGLERAGARVTNAARLVIGEVDRTFYQLASATQRTKLSEDVLALNARLENVAGRQLAEGAISRLDYNLAVVELGRALARSLATRREREAAANGLARLLGLPRGARIEALPDSLPVLAADRAHATPGGLREYPDSADRLDVEKLIEHALARRPDLAERSAAVRQTQALASLARREALPNPVLRGVMEQPGDGGSRTFRPGIGLTLPFLNRNQGERQALRAAARQAELERTALVAAVRAEIATAVASYESAASEAQVLERTVIAPARQNRQLAEIAYREGKIALPVLLLIQNQANGAELDYWTAWLAAREALANLAEATAQNVEGPGQTDMGARR